MKVNFETDETEQEREIEAKTREITEVFHHAEGLLKRFNKLAEDPNLTAPERTVRKNMQMSMAKKLQGLSMSFRATQKVRTHFVFHRIFNIVILCETAIHGKVTVPEKWQWC